MLVNLEQLRMRQFHLLQHLVLLCIILPVVLATCVVILDLLGEEVECLHFSKRRDQVDKLRVVECHVRLLILFRM